MAEFLTTQGTSYYIENIIVNAKTYLVLVSPYLNLSKNFYDRLKDADKRNVRMILVYGKDELKSDERRQLEALSNLSINFCRNLHAKCFFNEELMVITSMNMYEYSEKNNREMGVLIRKQEDDKVYTDAVKEVRSIIDSSEREQITKGTEDTGPSRVKQQATVKHKGYCIRCGTPITYDLDRPYCTGCFKVWSKWKDTEYIEFHCHECGQIDITTMSKPRCYDCFTRSRNRRAY